MHQLFGFPDSPETLVQKPLKHRHPEDTGRVAVILDHWKSPFAPGIRSRHTAHGEACALQWRLLPEAQDRTGQG